MGKLRKVRHHPLTRWRFEYGLTVSQCAKMLGIVQPYLSDIENGKGTSIALARKIVILTKRAVRLKDLRVKR